MNILMQTAGLILLLILLHFYLRQKTIGFHTEKLFFRMLLLSILCISLDILSVVVLVYHEFLPELFVRFVCKTYIASLLWVIFPALAYAYTDIYGANRTKRNRLTISAGFFTIVGTVLLYLLPIYYYVDASVCYTYGPSTLVTYAIALILIANTLAQCILNGDRMNPHRRNALQVWMALWILSAVIQFFNKQLLLVGYAAAIGIMILFFELENPVSNVERSTGFFHSHVLLDYMKECFQNDKPFSLMLISLAHYKRGNVSQQQIEQVTNEIGYFLRSVSNIKIFKNVEQELILLFDTPEKMDLTFQEYEEYRQTNYIHQNIEKSLNTINPFLSWEPLHIMMPDNRVARNAQEVLDLFKYYKDPRGGLPEDKVIYITEARAEKHRKNSEIEKMIISAISDDRVEVFFQPIYSIKKKTFTSAEALVRIRDTDGSIIPPGQFIPVAEETGIITLLGEIIFDKTCSFMKRHPLKELGMEYIESNLSITQCESRTLSESYIETMKKYGLDSAYINLEITETASLMTKKTLLENMEVLIDYGVSFSLDDFGSGNSNLNYIVDMPVSIVKFDMDMTRAYFNNDKAKLILPTAMRMIHSMQLKAVAEGVETAEQLAAMEDLGIDYIQGYYFSKPLDENSFLEFIKQRNLSA